MEVLGGRLGVDPWKDRLEEILGSLEAGETANVITRLRNLGADMGTGTAEQVLAACPHLSGYRPQLTRIYHEIIVQNEIAQARQFLDAGAKGAASVAEMGNTLTRRFYNRSRDMFEHLDFSNCRCFVLVGSGWVPLNLFAVHEHTGTELLVGLDMAAEPVEVCNRLVGHLGYERIKAIHRDGRDYDYRDADIVYVVGMVSGAKPAILSRIADTAPDHVQVVVNDPYSLARLWEEPVEPSLDPRLEVFARSPDWYAGRLPPGENVPRAALSKDLFIRRKNGQAEERRNPGA